MRKDMFIAALAATSMTLAGCDEDIYADGEARLVVEGWIDSGGQPMVLLTSTIPVDEEGQDLWDLGRYIVRNARVAVSDGESEVVLTGMYSLRRLPTYIYTTGDMTGEAGKTYRLTVDFRQFHAEAETTIPPPARIDSVVERRLERDAMGLTLHATDPLETKDYYQLFSCYLAWGNTFRACFMGAVDDAVTNGHIHIDVRPQNQYGGSFLLRRGQTLWLKLARMDSTSFNFWSDFQRSVSLSGNFIFRAEQSIRGNVRGALGYWCGYGSDILGVRLSTDTTEMQTTRPNQLTDMLLTAPRRESVVDAGRQRRGPQ